MSAEFLTVENATFLRFDNRVVNVNSIESLDYVYDYTAKFQLDGHELSINDATPYDLLSIANTDKIHEVIPGAINIHYSGGQVTTVAADSEVGQLLISTFGLTPPPNPYEHLKE